MKVFIYQWVAHENLDKNDNPVSLVVHGYGLDEKNKNICITVKNFHPWISIEVEGLEKTTDMTRSTLQSKIESLYKGPFLQNKLSRVLPRYKLYFDQNNKKFPIFRMFFETIKDRRTCFYRIKDKNVFLQNRNRKILVHEHEASPILQFLCKMNIPSCGWIEFKGNNVKESAKFTKTCREYEVQYKDIKACPTITSIPTFRFMSFDLEVYSSDSGRMPQSDLESDVIFQIGVYSNYGGRHLLTLGKDKFSLEDTKVSIFKNEKDLLIAFCNLVEEEDPHVLMGYNIFKFDIPYLVNRCKRYHIPVNEIGMPKDKIAEFKEVKWSSSAYAFQEFYYLDLEGRISVDLLPIVKRDYKFSNYKLSTISDFFLGDTKDPMTPREIFRSYSIGVLQNKVSKVRRCGKYCVQDSKLVYDLFEKIQAWIGLIEMAKICNIGIMPLFTQGQQIKIFSQVFKKCYQEDRLVDSFSAVKIPDNIVFDFDKYCGAYVFPPVPGKYNMVVPFDFTSLYPTTIIAFNIDYSTLVYDESVPDKECHVIEWQEDEVHYRYRFRKEPIGVIPSLLKSLLNQRNQTKRQLKQETDPTAKVVLDKRQLAYKVSANSMYGGMGVRRGYLPFLPGAMCTTAKGRQSIQNAAKFVQEAHGGKIIYGDSVSKDTILCMKEKNNVKLLFIEELFEKLEATPYPQFKPTEKDLIQKEKCDIAEKNLEIYSTKGWANVKRVIRHKTKKQLFKIYTSSGIVKVTEDHSLLLKNGECIKPKDLVPNKTQLNTCDDVLSISSLLEYQKETWNGIWYISDNYIHFHSDMNEKYIQYIYLTFKKEYKNLVFVNTSDGAIKIDLKNFSKISEGTVYRVEMLPTTEDNVYDIETEDGSFHAGIGGLIVKNTDSIYTHFPKYETTLTVWEKAKSLEEEFLALFPPPMKLLFEEKIYRDFLILSKKRYMAYTCGEDGILDKKMTTRGVLLARRDNCLWIRQLYERIVRLTMENATFFEIITILNQEVLDLFHWSPKNKNIYTFVVSKLLSHDYKIKALPDEVKKLKKRMQDLDLYSAKEYSASDIQDLNYYLQMDELRSEWKDFTENYPSSLQNEHIVKSCLKSKKFFIFCSFLEHKFANVKERTKMNIENYLNFLKKTYKDVKWLQQYKIKSQPAHAQLNEKMKIRGTPISPGSRMEFVIVEHFGDPKAKLFDKLEDPDYFTDHCDIYRLDRLYYLKNAYTPIDQLMKVCFKKEKVLQTIFNYHLQLKKVRDELKAKTGILLHYNK